MRLRAGSVCGLLVVVWALGCSAGEPIVGMDATVADIGIDIPTDTTPVCATPQVACGGSCADLQNDTANCGACGVACGELMVCVAGVCQIGCPATENVCGGQCVNFQTDRANCGACGDACAAGQVCSLGQCATNCASSLATCTTGTDGGVGSDGGVVTYCADVQTDRLNCGVCGNTCPNGNICMGGICLISCPGAQVVCDGTCRDLTSDGANCGACGHVCPTGDACVASTCTVACSAGLAVCGTACANLQTDNANCGACGTTCPAGQVCSGGACGTTCASPLTTCGSGATAYCANTAIDPSNCGACGMRCTLLNTTTAGCAMGACSVVVCGAGYGNCDGMAANGCETNLQTSANNCGACGVACALANASVACTAGACALTTCNTGYADCDHTASNGCEVNTQTDNGNCGACGTTCAAGQVCSHGTCSTTCGTPLATCGHGATAYCANTAVDPANCGACGTVCALANVAVESCVASACAIVRCATNYADCDGLASDGCEANLQTSVSNCGTCGIACPSSYVCMAGACILPCPSGETACSGACTATSTDANNCGACGAVCPGATNASGACTASICGLTCAPGFGDCDGIASNGCETSTVSSNTNCGTCGNSCGTGFTCMAGICESNSCPPPTGSTGTCTSVLFSEDWTEGVVNWTLRNAAYTTPLVTGMDSSACATPYLHETELASAGHAFTEEAIPVTGGQTYCLGGWVRGVLGSGPFFGVRATTPGGSGAPGEEHWLIGSACFPDSFGAVVSPVNANGQWHWYARSFAVPTGWTNLYIELEAWNGNGPGPVDFGALELVAGACPLASGTACILPSCGS